MMITPEIELQILHYYRVEGWREFAIATHLHLHPTVVQRILAQAGVPKVGPPKRPARIEMYLPFIRQTLEDFPELAASQLYPQLLKRGYCGGPAHFRHQIACLRPQFDASEWMLALLQKKIAIEDLRRQTDDLPDLEIFLSRLSNDSRFDKNKSLAILAFRRRLTTNTICTALGISSSTYSCYKDAFRHGGAEALFASRPCPRRKTDNDGLKSAIFKLLHEPPSNHAINRTTWTMPLFRKVLSESGNGACPDVIRSITRFAGYRWRKARVVLTSADPKYSEKLDRIHSILSNLKSDEAFFSIDEYGPFAVKMRGGLKLTAPGEQNVVPQWQKSRGSLILTGALELSSNRVTHFYSSKKNTAEMIKMMDVLVVNYANHRKLYLSWDAASWHISKQLNHQIEEHNSNAVKGGGVIVEAAPLPSGAQFLNVIESVFSGMSRAIIHNSDYPSVDDAKAAINRYFDERNDFFQKNPHRAGKKIWGKEREPAAFSESSNCKDPRYR
jgi:hypothetical protein